jgi:hypothetical protein
MGTVLDVPTDPEAMAPADPAADAGGVETRPAPPPDVVVHRDEPSRPLPATPTTPVAGMPDQISEALTVIETARAAAAAGDAAGTIRALRALPEPLLLADTGTFGAVTALVASAARVAGYDDLARTADRAGQSPEDPHALYGYGYSCVERGVAYLAVPALLRALTRAPHAGTVRMELVSALEAEARHAEAVEVLVGSDAMEQWTGRYLLVFNSLMAGDIDGAQQWYTRLGPPPERRQETMAARLTAMLARVQLLTGADVIDAAHTPENPNDTLGSADLRGWHFALNGGLLTTLSPYGADAGMGGRYAYLAETYSSCHWALRRLALVLNATGRRPPTVGLLPDRSSRILGMAAAEVLGVRAWDWRPQMDGALVVSYTLADAAPHILNGLGSAPGQILVEHATCWTDPPPVAADVTTFLHQVVVPPWAARQVPGEGDGWVEEPPDLRPEREIAAEILSSPAVPDPGDGSAPEDPDYALASFAERVAPQWGRTQTHRDRVWSPGPVRSSRFW